MQIDLTKAEIQMIAEMLSQAVVKVSQARIAAGLNDKIGDAMASIATAPADEKG